jgi:hypothetical protein
VRKRRPGPKFFHTRNAASADFTQTIKLDPKFVKTCYNRGNARKTKGNQSPAPPKISPKPPNSRATDSSARPPISHLASRGRLIL